MTPTPATNPVSGNWRPPPACPHCAGGKPGDDYLLCGSCAWRLFGEIGVRLFVRPAKGRKA